MSRLIITTTNSTLLDRHLDLKVFFHEEEPINSIHKSIVIYENVHRKNYIILNYTYKLIYVYRIIFLSCFTTLCLNVDRNRFLTVRTKLKVPSILNAHPSTVLALLMIECGVCFFISCFIKVIYWGMNLVLSAACSGKFTRLTC